MGIPDERGQNQSERNSEKEWNTTMKFYKVKAQQCGGSRGEIFG